MTEVVVATLNVNFAEDSEATGGVLKLEIDNRSNGINGGDTSFEPGDDVGFFMFKDSNIDIIAGPTSTSGGITTAQPSSGSKQLDEFISFSNSDSGSLGYPPSSGVDLEWMGRVYRIFEDADGRTRAVPYTNPPLPNRRYSQLKMPDNVAGVLRAKYTATGSLHRLRSVPTDITEVMIFAIGEIPSES